MKNHTNDCEVTRTGKCTCGDGITQKDWSDYLHRFGYVPTRDELIEWKAVRSMVGKGKAGTSRRIDTDPKITWLGDERYQHPLSCAVYSVHAPDGNWAPYCNCFIRDMRFHPPAVAVPMTDPGDPTDAAPRDVPKELRPDPQRFTSRAPAWVWTLIGFGAGLPLGAWAGWPTW